ncbi:MAG: hypothetical protein GY795_16530 [Desulfobacterales bacterium]|nr:hypothetical protein [Desulfobacterales bacterium]
MEHDLRNNSSNRRACNREILCMGLISNQSLQRAGGIGGLGNLQIRLAYRLSMCYQAVNL